MAKQRITIVIATTSEDKIEGILDAFKKYYPEDEYEIKVYSSKTDSKVPDQPFGNDTYQGAYNRINNAREKYEEALRNQGINVNYYVSCEAGIDDSNRVVINNKLTQLFASEQVVCIYDAQKDSYAFGKSGSWMIPTEDIEEIKKTDLDQYLRKRECTGLQDVGDGKYITRKDAVMEGTLSAIASGRFVERRDRVQKKAEEQSIEEK